MFLDSLNTYNQTVALPLQQEVQQQWAAAGTFAGSFMPHIIPRLQVPLMPSMNSFFFLINLFILFIYFWLHWVFFALCGLFL